MNEEWANNPNLKNIDPLKLKILNEFASEAQRKGPNELLPFFMASMQRANSNGISFNDSETELILNVLKTRMSSQDIKKIETIRNLSKIIAAKTNK
ncbi:MAG: hypothetical protein IIX45_02490 [Lachnospiraceae bacterium]|nr:hypothetical protein [Lachnospiraceae bacterium]